MRISDWSSDVCSSDLGGKDGDRHGRPGGRRTGGGDRLRYCLQPRGFVVCIRRADDHPIQDIPRKDDGIASIRSTRGNDMIPPIKFSLVAALPPGGPVGCAVGPAERRPEFDVCEKWVGQLCTAAVSGPSCIIIAQGNNFGW